MNESCLDINFPNNKANKNQHTDTQSKEQNKVENNITEKGYANTRQHINNLYEKSNYIQTRIIDTCQKYKVNHPKNIEIMDLNDTQGNTNTKKNNKSIRNQLSNVMRNKGKN